MGFAANALAVEALPDKAPVNVVALTDVNDGVALTLTLKVPPKDTLELPLRLVPKLVLILLFCSFALVTAPELMLRPPENEPPISPPVGDSPTFT